MLFSAYPLHVKLCRLALFIQPVSVDPALVDPVQLALKIVQVCLPE